MQRTAQIHLDGPTGTITVDGHDISHCVRGFTLTADVGHLPALDLDVVLHEADVDGQALITIPARTAVLLTALGWTPPADHNETAAVLAPAPSPSVALLTEVLRHPQGQALVVEVLQDEARRDPDRLSAAVRQAMHSTRSEAL